MSEAHEEYFVKAEALYHKVEDLKRKTGKCKAPQLPRVTYQELRAAFLPTRTKETVAKVGDKIQQSALELFANSELFDYNVAPSCRALGLEKLDKSSEDENGESENGERCYFEPEADEQGKHVLICDCPEGRGEYDAKSYAEEHVVKCKGKESTMNYSDYPEGLSKRVVHYQNAKRAGDVSSMVLAVDEMINAVHRSGPLADMFVVGGTKTLDKLATAKE